nr:UDP-N-acetyl-D-mannosamine dehydrogenase [Candidatus Woesebacteria bacterium]
MNKSPVVDVRKEKVVKQKNVCVIGLGYIGLPTALLLAAAGNRVLGVDLDTEKLRQLNQQKLPFDEPGLSALYDKVFEKGTFHIDDHPNHANFYII